MIEWIWDNWLGFCIVMGIICGLGVAFQDSEKRKKQQELIDAVKDKT